MRLIDIVLALICGEASALLINDLMKDYFFGARFLEYIFLFLLPILAILFLFAAELLAKRFFFVWQLAKHLLVGLLVVLFDLKIFVFLISLVATDSVWISGTVKAVSFLIPVVTIKFFGNKYWAFGMPAEALSPTLQSFGDGAAKAGEKQKNNLGKQFAIFLIVTIIGSLIDVGCFLFLTKFVMSQIGISSQIWVRISIVIAATVAAAWNFITYKFIVFKKENKKENVFSPIS